MRLIEILKYFFIFMKSEVFDWNYLNFIKILDIQLEF